MTDSHRTRQGRNYFKVDQTEHITAWGETNGSVLRSVEFRRGGNSRTFDITMHTDHKGSHATPLTLSMSLSLPVEYLDEIIDTLVDIRTHAVRQRQVEDEWETKQREGFAESARLRKLAEENDD